MISNNKRTFEEFLQEAHAEIFKDVLDDDLVDSYDFWRSEMESDSMLDYAELYGKEQFLEGQRDILIK